MNCRNTARRLSFALLFFAALVASAQSAGAWAYQQSVSNFIPYNPTVSLVKGSDGNLYGVTPTGGLYGVGQIVQITTGGMASTLASFNWANGGAPQAALIEGSDGNFYGTTSAGGEYGFGTFFSVTTGGVLSVLASFDGANGASVQAPLVETAPGVFYGVSYYGGSSGVGAVFKATVTTGAPTTITTVASFDSADGANPNALVYAGGTLYGTTYAGGHGHYGTVFRVKFANQTETKGSIQTAVFLSRTNGGGPTTLIVGQDGNLYGLSAYAQPASQTNGSSSGSIFRVTTAGKITTLAYFSFATTGQAANCLAQGADGNFYGATTYGGDVDAPTEDLGVLFKCVVTGESGTLSALAGWPVNVFANGASGLIFDSETQLFYGADARIPNGESEDNPGYPEVFSYSASAGYSVVATIPNPVTPPTGGRMIEGGDGNLYGITPAGGAYGKGTIFKILPGGAYLTLVNFDGTNGASPSALLLGSDGAIYGLTASGSSAGGSGNGTMFRMGLDGTLTTLVSFIGVMTGGSPCALLETSPGSFIGAASNGGAAGDGTLFQVAVTGDMGTITPFFTFFGVNGSGPSALMQARDGSFYGTTSGGGAGSGTIFQVSQDASTFTTLISFTGTGGAAPGANPTGAPVEAPDGYFYGVTLAGGANSVGTVYQLTSAGANSTLVSLLSFDGTVVPVTGSLLAGDDDALYGASTTKGLYRVTISGATGSLAELVPRLLQAFVQYEGSTAFSFFRASNGFYYVLCNEGVAAALGAPANGIPITSKGALLQGSLTSLLPDRPGSFSVTQFPDSAHGVLDLPTGARPFTAVEGEDLINRPNNVPLTIQYSYDDDGTFYVAVQDQLTRYQGVARQRETFSAKSPASSAGRYTVLLTPSDASGDPLPGVLPGYGVMDVAATGAVTLSGKLSDGTAISISSSLALDQTFTFYEPLYRSLGGLAGTVGFGAVPGVSDANGVLQWVRPAETGKTPVAALAANVQLLGSKFSATHLGMSATITLTESNQTKITHSLAISSKGKVTVTDPAADKTEVTLNLTTGAFTGTFTDPGTNKKGTFAGVIYEDQSLGVGELELNDALGAVALSF